MRRARAHGASRICDLIDSTDTASSWYFAPWRARWRGHRRGEEWGCMYAFCERVRARERRPWGFLCILEARVCHAASTQHARSSAPSDVLCPRARDARCLRIMDAPKLKQAVVSAKTGVNVCGFDSGTKRRQPLSSSGNALPLHTHTLSQSRTRTSACAGSRHQSAYVRQRGARHAPAEDSPTPRLPIPERGAAQSSAVLCVVRREQWRAVRATRARRSQHRPPAALAPRETDHPPAPPASRTDRRPIHPKARQVQAGTGQPQTGGPCSTFGNSLRSARPCRSTTYARTPIVLASVATSRVRHARRRKRARRPGSCGDPCSPLHGRTHGRRRTETGRNGGAGPREPPSRRGARRGSEDVHATRLEQRARERQVGCGGRCRWHLARARACSVAWEPGRHECAQK